MNALDPLSRARGAGWRLEGAEGVLRALAAEVLDDPAGALARGTLLRQTTQRSVARIALAGHGDVLLKLERESGLEDGLRRLFRPSRARAEWQAARALLARGVPVPEALALGERGGRALGERLTLYVARFLPDVASLGEVLGRLEAELARALLERVGALVLRMQRAGFDHRDLHPGNVLVGAPPAFELALIDLHRGRLKAPGRGASEAALARLLAGLRSDELAPAQVAEALLAGWQGGRVGLGALAARVDPRIQRLRRARERKHDGWALEASPWYAALQAPLQGVRDLAWPQSRIEARLAAHDDVLARGGPAVLKDRPKSAVTRHGDVIVKETRLSGWRGWFKRRLTPGRIVAGHVNAHRLRVRSVPTARSLALVVRAGRTFTLYEDLSHLPRLDDLARRLYAPGALRTAQARVRDASADWLADLHARGVYHGDVKSLHVLVEEHAHGPVFVLIDTDRVKILGGTVGRTRRLKNLAQLDASIPVCVSRSERLRWWRRYARRLAAGDDERAMARRLALLLARKTRVVHEPLE